MDIPSVNIGGVFQGANSGQVVQKTKASAEVPVIKQEVKAPVPEAIKTPKVSRYEAVKLAAEALKNTYAVSDVRFTIFKDVAGDYVTRFTSLRDGSVKYYPQKSLFEMAKIRNAQFEAMFSTEA